MSLDPRWLEGVDLSQPVSTLLDLADLEAEAAIALTLEEQERLEVAGQEYAQELYEQGFLDNLPPLDLPETLWTPKQDPDFGR